jgi:hypothetical protein
MWDELAGAALIDPSITGQKQLYMDIDVDHGASYGKMIFWDSAVQVPYLPALGQCPIRYRRTKFHKIYVDLMTRPARSANSHTHRGMKQSFNFRGSGRGQSLAQAATALACGIFEHTGIETK